MTPEEKLKQKFWSSIYNYFPAFSRVFLRFHEKGRQKYHIGWLAPHKNLEGLKKHLNNQWGFGNHFIAWSDEGQVLSWRKINDFNHQYHLRVFSDGEIRGHFEYTPEGHPIEHFEEKGEMDKTADFLKFLGEFVTQKKHISHLKADPNAFNPDSEICFEQTQATLNPKAYQPHCSADQKGDNDVSL